MVDPTVPREADGDRDRPPRVEEADAEAEVRRRRTFFFVRFLYEPAVRSIVFSGSDAFSKLNESVM